MKNIFKTVIEKGDYDLTATLKKIDKYHIEGKLTDADRDELYALARKEPKANYDYNVEIEKLWEAVRALQNNDKVEGDTNVTIPDFVQPTGAHDAYMKGDAITYNGKIYKSVIDNNVWSPDTYPTGWEVFE